MSLGDVAAYVLMTFIAVSGFILLMFLGALAFLQTVEEYREVFPEEPKETICQMSQ